MVDLNYLFGTMRRLSAGENYEPNRSNTILSDIYDAVLRKEDVVLDLAGARLTADACVAVNNAQLNGIRFCDTLSPDRDKLLRLNEERMKIEKESWVPLPEFTYRQDIKEFIKELDPEKTYIVPSTPDRLVTAITCLITLIRPSTKLVIDNIVGSLFKFIPLYVTTKELLNDTSWLVYTTHGVMEVNDGEEVFVQELNKTLPIDKAIQYGVIVPRKFGRDVLIRNQSWAPLCEACLTIIEEFQDSCPKKLSELYME